VTTFVGIDPGLDGAVAVISGEEIEIFDTPTYNDGKRRRIDAAGCSVILSGICYKGLPFVSIEKSQPMPKNGSIGCFSLGYSFGVWIGVLSSRGIPYELVTPQSWKKALMPGMPKEKDASRVACDRLWPGQRENWWSLKKHHGRADALLLAEFGRRKHGASGQSLIA
jgi:crossover junction endodeoxyribonuclease RuvC